MKRLSYYEALVLVDILHLVKEAESQGFDAAVIGCFYDTGLQDAREVAERMVVVAPCEASTRIASTLGDKFSIIVGRRKWIPQMYDSIKRHHPHWHRYWRHIHRFCAGGRAHGRVDA